MTSTRKGLRNQFKALLGLRKPGSLSPETARPVAANGTYDNSSPEGQLRQLGDLAFMLQDYETAASSYQLLATDLKADRAWRQFAATQVPVDMQHAEQLSADQQWELGACCTMTLPWCRNLVFATCPSFNSFGSPCSCLTFPRLHHFVPDATAVSLTPGRRCWR